MMFFGVFWNMNIGVNVEKCEICGKIICENVKYAGNGLIANNHICGIWLNIVICDIQNQIVLSRWSVCQLFSSYSPGILHSIWVWQRDVMVLNWWWGYEDWRIGGLEDRRMMIGGVAARCDGTLGVRRRANNPSPNL